MAQNNGHNFDVPSNVGSRITDTRVARGGSHPFSTAAKAALSDIGSMRTYLQSASATNYPNAVLDSMTANDMAFAIRVIEGGNAALTGIK